MSHTKTYACIKPGGDGCDGNHEPESLRERVDKALSQWLMSTSDELRITRLDRTDLIERILALVESEVASEREWAAGVCKQSADSWEEISEGATSTKYMHREVEARELERKIRAGRAQG